MKQEENKLKYRKHLCVYYAKINASLANVGKKVGHA